MSVYTIGFGLTPSSPLVPVMTRGYVHGTAQPKGHRLLVLRAWPRVEEPCKVLSANRDAEFRVVRVSAHDHAKQCPLCVDDRASAVAFMQGGAQYQKAMALGLSGAVHVSTRHDRHKRRRRRETKANRIDRHALMDRYGERSCSRLHGAVRRE